ncbi:uncharacterized protein [Triticum aestivum]|uniref:uncharacterized protein n=1 Tax=Triticum aestivum TaxID=4565 RepID=UPI001D02345B|nr:uncharacterized protein LOC123106389 [Triticum aestivum]
MVGPDAVRSGRRRRGRPPGIRAAVIACVRRAGSRLSAVDSSSAMAAAGGCGRLAAVDLGCRPRSATRRPFRSSWPGSAISVGSSSAVDGLASAVLHGGADGAQAAMVERQPAVAGALGRAGRGGVRPRSRARYVAPCQRRHVVVAVLC